MQMKKAEDNIKIDMKGLSPAEKRQRMREYIEDPAKDLNQRIHGLFDLTRHARRARRVWRRRRPSLSIQHKRHFGDHFAN